MIPDELMFAGLPVYVVSNGPSHTSFRVYRGTVTDFFAEGKGLKVAVEGECRQRIFIRRTRRLHLEYEDALEFAERLNALWLVWQQDESS